MSTETTPSIAGRTIRCLLFDIGETLWTRLHKTTIRNLEHVAEQRALALLYRHIPPTARPLSHTMQLGAQLRREVDRHTHQAALLCPGYEPDFALATRSALHSLGFLEIDTDVSAEIFEALRIRSSISRHVFEDVFPTMAELQKRGFLLGIVTNRQYGGQLFAEDLQQSGFFKYFDPCAIAVSADLGIRKPNPEIFRYALKALDVPPAETAMVGDSLRADIAGAQHLGMLAIWKPKLRLRAAAQAELLSQYSMLPLPQETTPLAEDQVLSAQTPELTDTYLLEYAWKHDKSREGHPEPAIEPDLIIEHTRDLLHLFTKAGKQ